jgi:hypothetical protein
MGLYPCRSAPCPAVYLSVCLSVSQSACPLRHSAVYSLFARLFACLRQCADPPASASARAYVNEIWDALRRSVCQLNWHQTHVDKYSHRQLPQLKRLINQIDSYLVSVSAPRSIYLASCRSAAVLPRLVRPPPLPVRPPRARARRPGIDDVCGASIIGTRCRPSLARRGWSVGWLAVAERRYTDLRHTAGPARCPRAGELLMLEDDRTDV